MSYRVIIQQVFAILIFTGVQVAMLKNLVLFDTAFCFIYIGFLLFLPFESGRTGLLLLGFLLGFVVDIFYDSLGIHAAAGVLIAFIRPAWINVLTPQGGYELNASPFLKQTGVTWFVSYTFALIFIHHLAIFFIEAGGFSMFFFTLVKVFSSAIFTFLVLVLAQLLFYRK